MIQYLRCSVLVASVVVLGTPQLAAQDAPQSATPPAQQVQPSQIPVQVEVVLSRYRGEKRVSSAPYVLSVKPNTNGRGATLRLMTSVPVITGDKVFQYRDVGMQIDASATGPRDGNYDLNVSINESSLIVDPGGQALPPPVPTTPLIRSYSSNNSLMLRDGQTKQYTAATEPVTGEVVRVDVTLRVVK